LVTLAAGRVAVLHGGVVLIRTICPFLPSFCFRAWRFVEGVAGSLLAEVGAVTKKDFPAESFLRFVAGG
jgi:hypothetical protein